VSPNRKSPWKILHAHPPALVRLCARRPVKGKTIRAVSIQEIAITSGLPLERVREISQSVNWDNITIPEAERFIAGCNFDPLSSNDRNRQSAYNRSCQNRKPQFKFLKASPWWETEFLPLIRLLQSQRAS
jgi:hypothetical protein